VASPPSRKLLIFQNRTFNALIYGPPAELHIRAIASSTPSHVYPRRADKSPRRGFIPQAQAA